jgi:hypothetical protein
MGLDAAAWRRSWALVLSSRLRMVSVAIGVRLIAMHSFPSTLAAFKSGVSAAASAWAKLER